MSLMSRRVNSLEMLIEHLPLINCHVNDVAVIDQINSDFSSYLIVDQFLTRKLHFPAEKTSLGAFQPCLLSCCQLAIK